MLQAPPSLSVNTVADVVRIAIAPVFLLSGIASFVNVCTSRLSRIVDRSRDLEPKLLASRGREHDRVSRHQGAEGFRREAHAAGGEELSQPLDRARDSLLCGLG